MASGGPRIGLRFSSGGFYPKRPELLAGSGSEMLSEFSEGARL